MSKNETPQEYTARILDNAGTRDPWEVLASTAGRIRAVIAGRTREDLSAPDPARWTIVQILAHLADAEVVAAWRLRSILAADGVPLQPFDQDAWASSFKYADADPFESLQLFEANRAANLSLLRRVDPSRHAHHGLHPERGQETIGHLIRLYAGHDLNHLAQIDRLAAALPARPFEPAPVKATATLEAAPDVRVGTIEAAGPVPGSRKLAALRVGFGDHHRTILAGIAQERSSLSSLVGRQALFVINLPPKPMAGMTSEGMLFDLGYADGLRPALAVPEFPVPDGTRAG